MRGLAGSHLISLLRRQLPLKGKRAGVGFLLWFATCVDGWWRLLRNLAWSHLISLLRRQLPLEGKRADVGFLLWFATCVDGWGDFLGSWRGTNGRPYDCGACSKPMVVV